MKYNGTLKDQKSNKRVNTSLKKLSLKTAGERLRMIKNNDISKHLHHKLQLHFKLSCMKFISNRLLIPMEHLAIQNIVFMVRMVNSGACQARINERGI